MPVQNEPTPVEVPGTNTDPATPNPYNTPDYIQTTIDLVNLGYDIGEFFGSDGGDVLTGISVIADGVGLIDDASAILNYPPQEQIDYWSSVQLDGIAPGAVYIVYDMIMERRASAYR